MFTFGADPEFALLDKYDQPKSAIGVLKGTKNKKKKIGNHQYYYDNVMVECAIKPASNKNEAIKFISECIETCARLAKPHKITLCPILEYPAKELKHRDAMEVGCKPERCAYTIFQHTPPEDVFYNTNLRMAGGHVHIGDPEIDNTGYDGLYLAKIMDLFVGIPSVLLAQQFEPTRLRRTFYGQAGRHRIPLHGVEYRTLDNFWLRTPKLVSLIYDLTEFSLNFVKSQKHWELWSIDHEALENDDNWNDENWESHMAHTCLAYDADEIQRVINEVDLNGTDAFLKLLKKYLPKQLLNNIFSLQKAKWTTIEDSWKLAA